ncbi:hypothetical protein M0R04_11280 [Candidatus Dojkabacteria bacterium]|jgi:hypothetical protein|nr:hypothetical protein [Candidatus Dojkabacteria bacterium]
MNKKKLLIKNNGIVIEVPKSTEQKFGERREEFVGNGTKFISYGVKLKKFKSNAKVTMVNL